MNAAMLAVVVTCVAGSIVGAQQPTYKRDVPDSLARKAKIREDSAVTLAKKRLPKATLAALEIEHEDGKLLWSMDMKTAGKDGIDEVNVDAMTGKVLPVSHESSADEAKEAKEDSIAAAKAAAAKAAAAKKGAVVKPPVKPPTA